MSFRLDDPLQGRRRPRPADAGLRLDAHVADRVAPYQPRNRAAALRRRAVARGLVLLAGGVASVLVLVGMGWLCIWVGVDHRGWLPLLLACLCALGMFGLAGCCWPWSGRR